MNVTELEKAEQFWTAVTGFNVMVSGIGWPTKYSALGEGTDITREQHSLLLQQVSDDKPPIQNYNAHLDLTVEDVDKAVEESLALGATMFREKGTYPLESDQPYLEWAVMLDPWGNKFCLIKDLFKKE